MLDRMFARRIGHVLVDHLGDPEGGGRRIEIERRADIGSHRASGRRGIQQHRAAGKAGRVDPAERDIGVGHGGAAAAAGVAGRAGVRSRAARADGDPAETVHAAQGAAAGADLDHLHHRDAQGQAAAALEAVGAVDLEIPRRLGPALVDQADLCRGAAHVEGDRPGGPGLPGDGGGIDRAAGRAGFDEPDREADRGFEGRQATVRQHDHERAGKAGLGQRPLQPMQIG